MSIKFVLSSDNKYVQYRCTADEFTTDTTQWAIAEESIYVENPEFVYVKTDKDGKILWAIEIDGGIYYGAGVPRQVVAYIQTKIDQYHGDDIVAFLNGLEEGDKTLQELLNERGEYIDNPEWVDAKTDSEGKLLEGFTRDGKKKVMVDTEYPNGIPSEIKEYVDNNSGIAYIDSYIDKIIAKPSISFGTPFTILSNKDEDATSLDKGELTFFNIIQLAENMFYMYYSAWGENSTINDFYQNILFAYSTDGIHYTRGFPNGIEAPFAGTNRIFADIQPINVTGQFVFKCLDPEYPFRLIAEQKEDGDNVYYTNMYKSIDGIHWDLSTKRTLCYEVNDTQHSVVVRGNILKLFTRTKTYVGGVNRRNCVYYFDHYGNLLSPKKILESDYVYNAAAIAIDDKYELINPTVFDNREGSQSYSLKSVLVNGYEEIPLLSDIDNIVDKDGEEKWATFSPTIVTIRGNQYLGYNSRNIYHDYQTLDNTSCFKLVQITINR